jgi:hypothetical protein
MKKRLCCHCKSYFDINHPKECLHQECEECSKLERLNEYYVMIISIEKNMEEENKKDNIRKYSCFICNIL